MRAVGYMYQDRHDSYSGRSTMNRSTEIPMPLGQLGKQQTDAITNMQKEILGAYEQANRAWLARMYTEMEFWSGLTTKLTATRSVPEAMEICQQGAAQRMQMAAEDGRR